MRQTYCCDDDRETFDNYYAGQCGKGMPVFEGARMQRGHGIGSIFSGLFRTIFPLFKKVAPVIGRKALQLADDVIGGRSFKDSAKQRLMEGIGEGINTFTSNKTDQSGQGFQRRKRRRQTKKKSTLSKRSKFQDGYIF